MKFVDKPLDLGYILDRLPRSNNTVVPECTAARRHYACYDDGVTYGGIGDAYVKGYQPRPQTHLVHSRWKYPLDRPRL